MCSYPDVCSVYTSPFLYVITSSPSQDGCLSLINHILGEMSNILCAVDRQEQSKGESLLKERIFQSSCEVHIL